jgi:CBS domain-containing protein
MTSDPIVLSASSTVLSAATAMRDNDVGNVIVGDDAGRILGIVTDRDIVVRVIAESGDPSAMTLGEVASVDLLTMSPDETVEDAIRTMQENAIRRLPVIEDGKAVGVVSLGDLAVQAEGEAVLDDISAAPPNS